MDSCPRGIRRTHPCDVTHAHNIIPTFFPDFLRQTPLQRFFRWILQLLNNGATKSANQDFPFSGGRFKLGVLNVAALLKQPSPAPYYFIHNPLASRHGAGQTRSTASPRQSKSTAGRAEAPNEGSSESSGEEGKQS